MPPQDEGSRLRSVTDGNSFDEQRRTSATCRPTRSGRRLRRRCASVWQPMSTRLPRMRAAATWDSSSRTVRRCPQSIATGISSTSTATPVCCWRRRSRSSNRSRLSRSRSRHSAGPSSVCRIRAPIVVRPSSPERRSRTPEHRGRPPRQVSVRGLRASPFSGTRSGGGVLGQTAQRSAGAGRRQHRLTARHGTAGRDPPRARVGPKWVLGPSVSRPSSPKDPFRTHLPLGGPDRTEAKSQQNQGKRRLIVVELNGIEPSAS